MRQRIDSVGLTTVILLIMVVIVGVSNNDLSKGTESSGVSDVDTIRSKRRS